MGPVVVATLRGGSMSNSARLSIMMIYYYY